MNSTTDIKIFTEYTPSNNYVEKLMRFSVFLLLLSIFAFPDVIYFTYISRGLTVASYFLYLIKLRTYVNNGYLLWTVVFITVAVLNVLFSFDITVSSRMLIILIQALALSFCVSNWLRQSKAFKFLFDAIICSACLLCFRLIQYIDFQNWGRRKVSTMLGVNVNSLGLRLAIAFLFCFLLFSIVQSKSRRRKYFLACCLLIAFILITASRRALVLAVTAACLISLLLPQHSLGRMKKVVFLVVLLIVVWNLIMTIPQLYTVIGSRMEHFVAGIFSSSAALDGGRDVMITRALELFADRPVIGWGMGNFRYISGIDHEYSHNTYVELLSAMGAIGFISYYSIFLVIASRAKAIKRKSISFVLFVCLLIMILLSDIASVNYTSLVSHLLFAIILSLPNSKDLIKEVKSGESG